MQVAVKMNLMQAAKLGNYTVYFDNSEEYHRIKREVWGANGYYIELDKEEPVIIDAGANIGLTTLYYKKLFPNAKIIAIEPLPQNLEILQRNIYENQLENIVVEEVALAESQGEREFFFDSTDERWYSTASLQRGAWTGDQTSSSLKVKTEKLSTYLQRYNPELVKMDIEGAEEKVLLEAKEKIRLCPNYLIEFHPIEGRGMERIIKMFMDSGFTIKVMKDGSVVPWQKAIGLSLIEATL